MKINRVKEIILANKECLETIINPNSHCGDCDDCPFNFQRGTNGEQIEAFEEVLKLIDDSEQSKTGHWIWTLEDWNKWECSECGFTKRTDVHVSIGYKFCPKCGARMEGREEKSKGE